MADPTFTFKNNASYAKGALIVTPFGYKKKNIPSWAGPIPFLLNPESINESLQGGWQHKLVPGQNDPSSSWIGNGPRTLSLVLLLTKDTSSYIPNQNQSNSTSIANPSIPTMFSSLGAAVAQIPLPVFQNLKPLVLGVDTSRTFSLSIANQLDQIRQLRYGELSKVKNGAYSTPPSLIKFQFDGSIDSSGNHVSNPTLGTSIDNQLGDVYWTVDSIDIQTTKWSSDLQPLEAEVKLTLVQFNDVNHSRSKIGK